MSLACLPWYDLAELRPSTDRFYGAVSRHLSRLGVTSPPSLNRQRHYEDQWRSGDLLLGQACGYDVLLAFAQKLQVVATPRYALDGCEGPRYRSFVVVGETLEAGSIADLAGTRCVINTPTSHSGMNMLRAVVAPLSTGGQFFADVVVSGAHERSLELIRRGAADVAAIDCVTHGYLMRHRPDALERTRVIARTVSVPAPPFVTSVHTPAATVDALRHALGLAVAEADGELALDGLEPLTLRDYEPIARLEREAGPLDGFPTAMLGAGESENG